MRKQKHTIYSFGLLLVSILCLVGGITAYAAMTMKEEKVNFFQIGNLQTKIDEVFTEPTTIAPEKAVEKKVSIVNTGTLNQFVRVLLHPEIHLESDGITRLLPANIGDELSVDINNTQWKLGEDGYYYYLNVLKPGDANASEALFTQVKLNDGLGAEYHKAKFNLLVKVEAISCTKDAYRDAWWQGVAPAKGQLLEISNQLAGKVE
ncbi:hypothetical protein [Enterococcus termitis]|uniref:Alternate signal-mediated exported protein n=1 Tax=Enterococcus termitis TaxID=332950 RepID=A0A1E5GBB5_9ENTE|nr:hypothetical protein [Enterococcus termitis]OEG09957.1 hypothetical protein BCR25_10695 [Enterococcus termitis]OJG98480.1 alternate signal-mediated exported protein [Enterococcus termitis]